MTRQERLAQRKARRKKRLRYIPTVLVILAIVAISLDIGHRPPKDQFSPARYYTCVNYQGIPELKHQGTDLPTCEHPTDKILGLDGKYYDQPQVTPEVANTVPGYQSGKH